jgi:serine/threonine-protein kinase HipA
VVNTAARKVTTEVRLGAAAEPVGRLSFVQDGRREYSAFAYQPTWLGHRDRFEISPDLPLAEGWVRRRAPTPLDSPFPHALADTAPDRWGIRVIRRAHAKRRAEDPSLKELTAFDLLAAVDDFSRIGALRLADEQGHFLRSADRHRTPQLLDLAPIAQSARRLEQGTESAEDLDYLMGKATSLGGMRPKCTVLEEDGALALGKFPSVGDERSVVRGEVLALKLVDPLGRRAASARVVTVEGVEVAVIRRFDRTPEGSRIPYLSGGSLLQARRDEDRTYTELADRIRAISPQPLADVKELWRRLLINHLLTNVDDHLWNVGFLYVGDGRWSLAPAFDVNPFPDKARESKTWLSEDTGPITSLEQLLGGADYLGLTRAEAETEAAAVALELGRWREVATSPEVGMSARDLADFEPAFEHACARAARALAR